MIIWLIIASLISTNLMSIDKEISYTTPETEQQTQPNTIFFVSRNGNNQDGLSWESAWDELDQIDWSIIKPGDTIYLDGGEEQMTYETQLIINQSGTSDHPIKVLVSSEIEHNGQVIFSGGREQLLPYCGQQEFDNSDEETLQRIGIHFNSHDNIIIDGMNWSGIVIHGYSVGGIVIEYDSENITVRNVEIYNNGKAVHNESGWTSDLPGVRLAGQNVTFQQVIIHDNGQDAFQSSSEPQNLSNFVLEDSWLYNGRQHPLNFGKSWNDCTHTDGIQIYGGEILSGITIRRSIIGPGFMQNLILGQTPNSYGEWAAVQDVTLENVLFANATGNSIYGYSDTDSQNWKIDRVTAYCSTTPGQCLQVHNANHSVTNSIFYGGRIYLPDGLDTYENNCVWNLISSSVAIGEEIDPNFANVSDANDFSINDFTVQNSDCIGSNITSIEQLMQLP